MLNICEIKEISTTSRFCFHQLWATNAKYKTWEESFTYRLSLLARRVYTYIILILFFNSTITIGVISKASIIRFKSNHIPLYSINDNVIKELSSPIFLLIFYFNPKPNSNLTLLNGILGCNVCIYIYAVAVRRL